MTYMQIHSTLLLQCSCLLPVNLITCPPKIAHGRLKWERLVSLVVAVSEPPQKKRCVAIRTVQKWITSCDRELGTALWLKYEKYDRDHVASINCSICTTFDEKIRGSRNYNDAFIIGSTNLLTSSFDQGSC